jgi:hypothetical protein
LVLDKLKKRETPYWVWLLGLLPWVWVVPLNQYFWDDWKNAPFTGFQELNTRWAGGAKHFLNPIIYFALTPFGPWVFHSVMILANLVAAVSLRTVAAHIPKLSTSVRNWIGPIFLVLPVFHARFSVAVLEYSLALAALLLAWAISLSSVSARTWIISTIVLIYAIGVPSLGVLFPLAWIHVASCGGRNGLHNSRLRLYAMHSQFLVIPLVYAGLFSVVLNSESYYKVSGGALIEFVRGLVSLCLVAGLVLVFLSWQRSEVFSRWKLPALMLLIAYFGFFPYFATGYNPLSDFLPWRMRPQVIADLKKSLVWSTGVLSMVACLGTPWVRRNVRELRDRGGYLATAPPLAFGVLAICFGPMDWESRHWLVAWPSLSFVIALAVSILARDRERELLRSAFIILFSATAVISSEYLADALKQRAISQAAAQAVEAPRFVRFLEERRKIIVVLETNSTANLNARYRNYRPFEWWGLFATGLGVSPWDVQILEQQDLEFWQRSSCEKPQPAVLVRPEVRTSRLEALLRMEVEVDLNATNSELCEGVVLQGWPRTKLP